MMVLIFVLLLVSMLTAWLGRRRLTVSLFLITLLMAALWFWHQGIPASGLRL